MIGRHLFFVLSIGFALSSLTGCGSNDPVDDAEANPSVTADLVETESATKKTFIERGYVGSEACRDCHGDISESYAKHSMGKSAVPIADYLATRGDSANFNADGFRYRVRIKDGKCIHHQGRLAADGSETAAIDLEVAHVIGSGNHGQSFLVDRDGFLFMSPITWYPDDDIWALSPGYKKNNSQFNRPVVELCLYCHTDGANSVQQVVNQYQSPTFHGHAISCERCHGPGEAHIAAQENEATGANIVNPSKLSPSLREAVCQQCHLSGVARVLKPNRSLYDFQPGQSLESAYTIYTLKTEENSFVGHVEQMHESQCFRGSDGKLGCVSCHDPHSLPEPEQKIAFYRDRCLDCHASQGCSLEVAKRTEVTSEDSCIVCHMPKMETEILHAAVTDHSVPRTSDSTAKAPGDKSLRLEPFPSRAAAKPTPRDDALAIALASAKHPELLDGDQFDIALQALKNAVAENANDFAAAEALADFYLANNEVGDAIRLCQQVLEKEPKRERTLHIVCETLNRLGDHHQAISYWQKIIEVNPWSSKYRYQLAKSYAATAQWARCRETAVTGKERFPTSIGLRQLLVQSCLELGDLATADAEFKDLVNFKPPAVEKIREWYEQHPKRQTAQTGGSP